MLRRGRGVRSPSSEAQYMDRNSQSNDWISWGRRLFLCSLWEFLPGVAVVLSAIPSVPVTITGSVLSAYDSFFPLPGILCFVKKPVLNHSRLVAQFVALQLLKRGSTIEPKTPKEIQGMPLSVLLEKEVGTNRQKGGLP
ncbi:hypothetical protein Ancab_039484 [Ancistrocladus abbreviatus]